MRRTHPSLPIILYISGSGGLLERMAAANPDIISIDQSVDIVDGIKRVGSGFAIQVRASAVEAARGLYRLRPHNMQQGAPTREPTPCRALACSPHAPPPIDLPTPQGNMDPGVLFGSKDVIESRVLDTIRRAKSQGVRHIMNLGHGVLPGTPEENVAHFFEVARTAHERL